MKIKIWQFCRKKYVQTVYQDLVYLVYNTKNSLGTDSKRRGMIKSQITNSLCPITKASTVYAKHLTEEWTGVFNKAVGGVNSICARKIVLQLSRYSLRL